MMCAHKIPQDGALIQFLIQQITSSQGLEHVHDNLDQMESILGSAAIILH